MLDRSNQPWSPLEHPELDWVEGVPRHRSFDDIYYSAADGRAESQHVFIDGSGVRDKLSAGSLVVAETGFGTGLNFLLLLQAWRDAASDRKAASRLHYIGLEAQPMTRQQLQQALAKWPELQSVADRLLADWPGPVPGCHRLHWQDWDVILDLWWDDAVDVLEDLASRNRRLVDVWFLDGFAPARDHRLWSGDMYRAMAELSLPDARFATFTAAGAVRRGLEDAGFQVNKRPGYGAKRESLHGRYPPSSIGSGASHTTPWDLAPPCPKPTSALVLGAGLAGSFTARALAERGVAVTVLERASVADGGSSNLQGLTYTRPSRKHSPLADFALASYLFACRLYKQLIGTTLDQDLDGAPCGYLQVMDDAETLDYLSQISGDNLPFSVLSADAASARLGLQVTSRALYFANACWLNPRAVCRERLQHPLIKVHERLGDCGVASAPEGWQVTTADGIPYHGEVLIACTAHGLTGMPETRWLPLQAIRGQTTHVPATPASATLGTAFCHEGYLPPSRQGLHCLGASYGPNDLGLDQRSEEHTANLAKLNALLPDLGFPDNGKHLQGHVALRCTSADYLPVAGPVPDREAFNTCYAEWRTRKTRIIDKPCPALPGLYVLAGLGSRGLTAAPLAAEVIASELFQEPSPVPRALQQALAPARFLKRAIIRGNPL